MLKKWLMIAFAFTWEVQMQFKNIRLRFATFPALTSRANSLLRSIFKNFVGILIRFSPYIRRSIDGGVTVFTFHNVTNSPSEFAKRYGLAISTQIFEAQILWIKENFEIIHPSMILTAKRLPKRAAVITFDDGYLGTFENGLPILNRLNVPSIIFLNMQPILSGFPILSAIVCFLDDLTPDFGVFCRNHGLQSPFHLSMSPEVWGHYQHKLGSINIDQVSEFQGAFADLDTLLQWDSHPLVEYGNHLFEHWNAAALPLLELENQYLSNEAALSRFSSTVNLFAFTNGQPNTCFSSREILLLKSLHAGKVFSTAGGVNMDKQDFLLGRIALNQSDNTSSGLWYRVGRAILDQRRNNESNFTL